MLENKLESKNYFIFATFFIVSSFFILNSFLFGILWGGVTALAAWPVFEKMSRRLSSTKLKLSTGQASLLFAIVFFLLFITPFAYAGLELADAYSAGTSYISSNAVGGVMAPPAFLAYLPFSAKLSAWWNSTISPSSGVLDAMNKASNGKLVDWLSALWGQLMGKMISVVVMLVSFYFMLKNGQYVKDSYRGIFAHWLGPKSLLYVDSGIQALRGTINGVVLIGIVEGMLLAIPLVLGGLSSGFLIALCAGILGVIPLLMPALIIPCLGYMYLSGQTTWAIIGAVDLVLVWFLFENVIKPQMISQKIKINTFIILVAMVGGMQLMGLVGLFLGPAIISMAIGMLKDLAVVPSQTATAPELVQKLG